MNNLGRNIKHLRKQQKYSQIELASIIGVSQTSVAHYEAGTRQPTIETLMELSQLFSQPIDLLVGNLVESKKSMSSKLDQDDLIEDLVESLVSKNENQFVKTLNGSVYPYYEINSMVDGILNKVMYKIGTLWERGIISEADEHYATNVVRKVVGYISLKNTDTIKDKKAISFTVGSEKHTLGLEMVNAYLESVGVNSLYLGSDLPVRSLEKVIKEYNPNYIFISITMSESMNSLVHLIDYINEKYKSEIIIGVGGQGLTYTEDLKKHKNLHVLNSIDELIELVNR